MFAGNCIAVQCAVEDGEIHVISALPATIIPVCVSVTDDRVECEYVQTYTAGSSAGIDQSIINLFNPNSWYAPYCNSICGSNSTYPFLREVMEYGSAQLRKKMWVTLELLPCIPHRDIAKWMILSLELAREYPRGIAVFDLESEKTLIFVPFKAPCMANPASALSWLRDIVGGIGIALCSTCTAYVYVSSETMTIDAVQCKYNIIEAVTRVNGSFVGF